MRIIAIRLQRLRVPLDPPFPAAWDPVPRTVFPVTIVRVETDEGVTGIGSGDTMDGFEAFEHLFVGQDPLAIARHVRALETIDFHAGRYWPLEVALWDIIGQVAGLPVATLFGGAVEGIPAYASCGSLLPAAERALVEQRPTRSIAAFLAYSAGLMAEDAGNLEDAERHYANAVRLDPNFRAAREKRESIEAERATEVTALSAMEATLTGTTEGLVATAADRGTVAPESRTGPELTMGGTLTTVINDLNPSPVGDAAGGGGTPTRDPASSTTGTDNPAGGTGRIRIIVPQPSPRRAP